MSERARPAHLLPTEMSVIMGSKDTRTTDIKKPKKFVPKPLPLRPLVRAIQEAASKDRPN